VYPRRIPAVRTNIGASIIRQVKARITNPFSANPAMIEEKHRLPVCPLKGGAVFVDPKQFIHFIAFDFGKSAPRKGDGRAAPFSAASVTIKHKGEAAFFGAVHAFFRERFEHLVKLTSFAAICGCLQEKNTPEREP
jgi:hypothetical protein